MSDRSRYRAAGSPDYSHRFHAGNVGDVWKHCILVDVLRRMAAASKRVVYVETHAGEGRYALGPTGEWTEGIGRLLDVAGDDAVARYVTLARRLGHGAARPEIYPGSPAFARAVLGPDADLILHERDPAAFAALAASLGGDAHVRLLQEDGLTGVVRALQDAEARADAVVVLIDPSWGAKSDWTVVPEALVAAARASTRACLVLWYPVKSLTRPNAMLARLERAGIGAVLAELVTTPLERKGRRLNGSGLLVVRAAAGALGTIAAAAPIIGERCATHGSWSFRIRADSRPGKPAPAIPSSSGRLPGAHKSRKSP